MYVRLHAHACAEKKKSKRHPARWEPGARPRLHSARRSVQGILIFRILIISRIWRILRIQKVGDNSLDDIHPAMTAHMYLKVCEATSFLSTLFVRHVSKILFFCLGWLSPLPLALPTCLYHLCDRCKANHATGLEHSCTSPCLHELWLLFSQPMLTKIQVSFYVSIVFFFFLPHRYPSIFAANSSRLKGINSDISRPGYDFKLPTCRKPTWFSLYDERGLNSNWRTPQTLPCYALGLTSLIPKKENKSAINVPLFYSLQV